jgi:hypothetical protein
VRGQTAGKQSLLGDIFVFLIPCSLFLEFNIGGRLFASEILLLGVLPFLMLSKGRKLLEPIPRTVILLSFFWFVGQFTTDLIRSTPFEDYSRGWAKIIFFSTNCMALYLLLGLSTRRWLALASGLSAGLSINFFYSPSANALDYPPWKFGLGVAISVMIALVISSWFVKYALHKKLKIPLRAIVPSEHYLLLIVVLCCIAISMWINGLNLSNQNVVISGAFNLGVYLMIVGTVTWFHPIKKYCFADLKS